MEGRRGDAGNQAVPLPKGVIDRQEEAEHPMRHFLQPLLAFFYPLDHFKQLCAQNGLDISEGGLGGGRGEGGVEEDVGRDREDLGQVNAKLGDEIKSEEGDGAVVAAGGEAGVEFVLDVGRAGVWWG